MYTHSIHFFMASQIFIFKIQSLKLKHGLNFFHKLITLTSYKCFLSVPPITAPFLENKKESYLNLSVFKFSNFCIGESLPDSSKLPVRQEGDSINCTY
jgi:hypothetical protein